MIVLRNLLGEKVFVLGRDYDGHYPFEYSRVIIGNPRVLSDISRVMVMNVIFDKDEERQDFIKLSYTFYTIRLTKKYTNDISAPILFKVVNVE